MFKKNSKESLAAEMKSLKKLEKEAAALENSLEDCAIQDMTPDDEVDQTGKKIYL